MINLHIVHACRIGNRSILANYVTLNGHVNSDDYPIDGGIPALHKFCNVGQYALLGNYFEVTQGVTPSIIAQGNHATSCGINNKGLRKHGFSLDTLGAGLVAPLLALFSGQQHQLHHNFTQLHRNANQHATQAVLKLATGY